MNTEPADAMESNIRLISRLLSIAAALFTVAAQAGSPESDPFAVDAKHPESPSNPNHLEPLPAYAPDGYDQAVFQSLIGKDPGELWMIGKPSFGPEYAVVLRHELTYSNPEEPFDRTIALEKWMIERVEAKRQIWRWRQLCGGRMELDIHATKDVIRQRSEVTKDFASQMLLAWESVLRKTRYPDEDYRGLDGTTFQFYCRHNFFGEVWTPRTGLPNMLTELGHRLADVVKASDEARPKLVAECVEIAKKITAETRKPEVGPRKEFAPGSQTQGKPGEGETHRQQKK